MPDLRSAVEQTPLSQQGHSLQAGELTADQGLISNASLSGRPQTAARALNNMQQIVPGIWTSQNLGWQRQRALAFNVQFSLGTPFREFSWFIDNTGARTMLFQVYDTLYSYNLGTNTETAILAGLNNSPANTPCMRRSFSPLTGKAIVVYTNGDIQPQKLTSPTAVSALGWNMKVTTTTPAAPSITQAGTPGATGYTYLIVPVWTTSVNGAPVNNLILSPGGSTATGAATLTGVNFNNITFAPVAGANSYLIYRTAGGPTQGKIATLTTWTQSTVSPGQITVADTGLVGDGTTATATGALTGVSINSVSQWPGALPLVGYKQYQKAKFCEPLGAQRFVYGGFPDAATAFDIVISSFAGPEDFTQTAGTPLTTDAAAFTYPPELGQLTGIKVFRSSNQTNDTIVIGACANGIFQIIGNTASNYQLFVLTTEVGIVSNRTWVQLSNDVYFLSTSGYRNFSSLANNAILTPDEISNPIHDIFQQIDPAFAYLAHACHNPKTQEVQVWYPQLTDGGLCSHGVIANYNAGTSNPLKWSTRDGTTVNCSMVFNGQFYGGGNDGLLQQHYTSNLYDTNPMRFQLYLAIFGLGNTQQKCSVRNLQFVTEGDSQQFLVTVYVTTKMSDQNGKTGYRRRVAFQGVLSDILPPGTALGTWALGYGAFPGNYPKFLDCEPLGNGVLWDIEITSRTSSDALDFVAVNYTLSGGGFSR